MKRFLSAILLLLTASGIACATDAKVGMYIGAETVANIESADEKKAAEWFLSACSDGIIITPSTLQRMEDVAVLWVATDRVGIEFGWKQLPQPFSNESFVNALKSYVAAGGNLLLTNHATQLTVAVGRIADTYAPTIFGNGEGGHNPDVWGVHPIIGNVEGQIYDHRQHAIYKNLTYQPELYAGIYCFEGDGVKGDHNCMWDLNLPTYGLVPNPNVVRTWEELTNSTVLGTWNHVVDYCCAGIVDFEPTTAITGRILAVGLASYEWDQNGAANAYQRQLEQFTRNCLDYLLADAKTDDGNNVPAVAEDVDAEAVAHFNMTLTNGCIQDTRSATSYAVVSQLPATSILGLTGHALRFDGYSNYVKAALPATLGTDMTLSVTLAAESYPMMQTDNAEVTPTYATICGNFDATAKTGFALQLSSQGDLRMAYGLREVSSDVEYSEKASKKLPRGCWNVVTATFDTQTKMMTLYLNGESVLQQRMGNYVLAHGTAPFFIGKDATEVRQDKNLINTFCGLIDNIAIYNSVKVPAPFASAQRPDFGYPATRYADQLWRPQFHGMPSGSWTNETHGMTYSNGRYHLFFQKNANGPYMSRLHWGHLSSANLCDWHEEPIAVYPSDPFDVKGCWSGCVYDDGGTPTILYTAVDNAKARIVKTTPADATLNDWQQKTVVIDGCPAGMSDDFRDPYCFEANGQKYIIVGTSKGNIGACTLHRWNGTSYSNNGDIFFQGANASAHGTFWEMPNVTPMGNGKYLFTCTPLGTANGVRTLCWVGTIGADGKFQPDGNGMQYLEMEGISRNGYGLLSPTIFPSRLSTQTNGALSSERTLDSNLLMGIVPDKLPSDVNYEMGWAHTYSLPRQLSLDADGYLVQKPYSGLTALRSDQRFTMTQNLLGTQSLAPVSGRQLELVGEFVVAGSGTMGFHFLKNGDRQAVLSYDAANGQLSLDATSLARVVNDGGVYDGKYIASLPKTLPAGSRLKLQVFLDGSIVDVFVCDTWAFSVRLFPTDANATEVEAFATTTTPASISAWTLTPPQPTTGISEAVQAAGHTDNGAGSSCYNLAGQRINRPSKGFYIMNGKKYVGH